MGQTIRFDDQVAIVTGSGQGIGRAYAELLAARGAKVVVNDVGSRTAGGGADAGRAARAVEAIVAAGGTAVADASDVSTTTGAESLVATAMEAFGRLDIVVNNAGIFTTDAFPDAEADLLRRMLDVHVIGSFNVCRAAWPHLEQAGYGRVVLTTSTSALGAADTVAYTTAKSGVLGLGRALAKAGEPAGIKVNLVAPMAMTRMMASGMGRGDDVPDVPERSPALVAPLVAILCHESCPTSGEAYMSGMRRFSRLFIAETNGYTNPDLDITPEIVHEKWVAISSGQDAAVVSDTRGWGERNETFLQ